MNNTVFVLMDDSAIVRVYDKASLAREHLEAVKASAQLLGYDVDWNADRNWVSYESSSGIREIWKYEEHNIETSVNYSQD
jgi:hypothetical protein